MLKIKYIFILAFITMSVCQSMAQNTNIWDATGQFLIKIGERTSQSMKYPGKDKDGQQVLPYMIIGVDVVNDPNYKIPVNRKIDYYSFGTLAAHVPMHILITKDGKYYPINMKESLTCIMTHCIKLCEEFALSYTETLHVFEWILQRYSYNFNNSGGVKIEGDSTESPTTPILVTQ